MLIHFLEWMGCCLALIGATMLACNFRHSAWGFVAYLISNVCWIGYGYLSAAWGLVIMQAGFSITSVIGIVRWFHPQRTLLDWLDRPGLRAIFAWYVAPRRGALGLAVQRSQLLAQRRSML